MKISNPSNRVCSISLFIGLFIIMCFAFGCNEQERGEKCSIAFNILGVSYREVEYDGCQYLQKIGGYSGGIICHKGNCTNSIHFKKE